MRKRLGLVGAGAVAALAVASAALAAYSPTLTITRHIDVAGGATTTDIAFAQTDADDPTATVAISAPAGFTVTLNQAVGAQIGTLEGSVVAGALAGATVPVGGTVTVGDPNNPALRAAAKQCTNIETHAAVWLLNVTAAGQSLPAPVPVFVDPVTTPPFSTFASASIVLCLPHPSVATLGIKLLSATLHLTNVFAPPAAPGAYRWTAVNVPYASNASVNLLGSIETQAIDRTPVTASFSTKLVTKTRKVKRKKGTYVYYSYFAKLSGQVRSGGQAAAGANVDILVGDKKLATATTNAKGSFSLTRKLTKTTTFHAVFSKNPSTIAGATCVPALPLVSGPMPCGAVTEAGFSATSGDRTIRKPKLTVKLIKAKKKRK